MGLMLLGVMDGVNASGVKVAMGHDVVKCWWENGDTRD